MIDCYAGRRRVTQYSKVKTYTAPGEKKTWATDEIIYCCNQRRDLRKKKDELDRDKDYREINKNIEKGMHITK